MAINLLPIYTANMLGIILILILLIGNSWRFRQNDIETKVLLVLVLVTLSACIVDPLACTFDGKPGTIPMLIIYAANSWLYVCNMVTTLSWLIFLSLHLNGKLYKVNTIVMGALSTFGIVLIIINIHFPLIFRLDENNVYSRCGAYYIFAIIALIYIVNSVVIYSRSLKSGGFFKFFPIWLFILPLIAGILVQSFCYGLSIIWPCVAVAVCGVVVALQNETIFRDQLTGLFNRSYFDYIKERYESRMPEKITGIMLDINRFKAINDTFGHSVGDEALKITADILRRSVGDEGTVIRYAGDEFIILINTHDDSVIESMVDRIRGNFCKFNECGGKDYHLSVSLGFDKMDCNIHSINDFMNEIDKHMYEDKSNFYIQNPHLERRIINDQLTGLYNKRTFYVTARAMINRSPDDNFHLILTDIDNFKLINQKHGEKVGDDLLKYIGKNLLKMNNQNCIFARYSGDQFVGLIKEQSGEALDMNSFIGAIDTMYRDAPIDTFGVKYGVYCNVDRELSVQCMCDKALIAVESIKHQYNDMIAYYDDDMERELKKHEQIISGMRKALDNDEFKVYYQPKYDIGTERVIGAEALVRWDHPEYGLMTPDQFISIFENSGFIANMDEYIWDRTCQLVEAWKHQGIDVPPISINVSRRELLNDEFLDVVNVQFEKYDIEPSDFHMEITESVYIETPEMIMDKVEKIRDMGIKVELDDFGSGFSSLSLFSKIPIDIVKIDRAFVRDIDNQADIIESIIMLAHRMDCHTIAEGVEEPNQLQVLRELDCDYVQGYYYSKPLPADEFLEYIKKY